MTDLLQQAIIAIKTGDTELGRQLLSQILVTDPDNEAAWLWMSAGIPDEVPDALEQRYQCLEQVLRINPENTQARRGIEKLSLLLPPEPPKPVVEEEAPQDLSDLGREPAVPEPVSPSMEETMSQDLAELDRFISSLPAEPDALEPTSLDAEIPLSSEAGPSLPAFTWPLEPEQRDLAQDQEADLGRLFGSLDKTEPALPPASPAGEPAESPVSWPFEDTQPATADAEAAPGEYNETSFSADLDRLFGSDEGEKPLKSSAFTTDELPLPSQGAVAAFTFDEGSAEVLTQAAIPLPGEAIPLGEGDSAMPVQLRLEDISIPENPPIAFVDPPSSRNRMTIFTDRYMIVSNPPAADLERIQGEVAQGQIRRRSLGASARTIALEHVTRVKGDLKDNYFNVHYARGPRARREKVYFASPQVRDEALDELHVRLGAEFVKVTEVPALLRAGLVPFLTILLILALTAGGVIGLLSVRSAMNTYLASLGLSSIFSLVLPILALGIGLLLVFGAIFWLLNRLRHAPQTVSLERETPPETP